MCFYFKAWYRAHCKSERASIVSATCNIAIGFFAEETSSPCTDSSFCFLKFNKISELVKESLQCSEHFQNNAVTPFLSLAMGNLWNNILFSKFSIYISRKDVNCSGSHRYCWIGSHNGNKQCFLGRFFLSLKTVCGKKEFISSQMTQQHYCGVNILWPIVILN